MHTISNDFVTLSFDEMGNLTELSNNTTKKNYASGKVIWRLICSRDLNFEYQICPDKTKPTIEKIDDSLSLKYDHLESPDGSFAISATITAKLENENVLWDIELTNNDEEMVIRECFFPMITDCQISDNQDIIWPSLGGQKIENPRKALQKYETRYMALDEDGLVMNALYPGVMTSMNFIMFADEKEGLYIASHDKSLQQTIHYFRLVKKTQIEAGLVKYPFVKPGEKKKIVGFVTSPYAGSWHRAVDKYTAWFNDNFKKTYDRQPWLEDFNGWQRVIMKHQYGKTLFGYDQMEQIYQDGKPANIHGAFLFGWHNDGHDAGYPLFNFDEKQGGKEAFQAGVKKIQKAGGKVILYFNGHLIEMGGDYYNSIGKNICAKNERGLPYTEQYRFSGQGTIHRQFGNRIFVGACPSSKDWLEHLKSLCDIALDLEVDAIFFDQMGGWDNVMCFDKSHGHPVPFTTIGQAKADLLENLYKYVKSKNPKMAFGTEILCDSTAHKVDFVHNLWGATSDGGFINLFRYAFPDIILSDRDIRDEENVPARVNHALAKGLISDVEIYRCRKTIAETPNYSAYLTKINSLREKYASLLLQGKYRDTQGFNVSDNSITATRFDNGTQSAIILTQDHEEKISATLSLSGYNLIKTDGLGDYEIKEIHDNESYSVELKKEALAICIFEKK